MDAASVIVLAGDIGGTHSRFAVMTEREGRLDFIDEVTYPSRELPSLSDALEALASDSPASREAEIACIGIAGPIRANRCAATNLPWVIDGGDLARVLGLPEVRLLNDLEAAAWGLGQVAPSDVRTLRSGERDPVGTRALLAPGTGLGEATLPWDGERHVPLASEGGHADFAPADELQIELWRFLAGRFGHVSWERVLSGQGLVSLFRFLRARDGEEDPDWLAREERSGDPAAGVSGRARDGSCRYCRAALDLFVEILAAEAGNLALRTLATGGLYLAGGMVPKLQEELEAPRFLEVFSAKGRMRDLLDEIPVAMVLDDRIGLRGAAAWAFRQVSLEGALGVGRGR